MPLQTLREDHPDTRWSACHLVELAACQAEADGDLASALELFSQAITQRVVVRAESDPSTRRCREAAERIAGAMPTESKKKKAKDKKKDKKCGTQA